MKIRISSKFTDKITGDIPFFGTDVFTSKGAALLAIGAHIKAVADDPFLMIEFKITNVENL